MTRKRAVGDGEPAARRAMRRKDRRPLAVETSLLESRVAALETIVVAQDYRLSILMRLNAVLDEDLVEFERKEGDDGATPNAKG